MGLFSRKGKSVKDEVKADEKKDEKPKTEHKQTSEPTSQGSRSASYMERRRMENARRMESSQYDNTLNNASFPQETAHGMSSGPPSPNAQRAATTGMYSEHGSYNSSAPPSFKNRSSYFANSSTHGKQPTSTGYYSDSGYESAEPTSAMHSRVPSEHNLHESSKGYYLQNTTLPVLSLSGENSLEAEIAANSKSIGNVSPLDLNSDARSVKSNRSVSKRTRFEDDAEPMPALDQLEQHRKDSGEETREQPQHPQRPKSLRGGSLPPLAILDGFKVNKKGKILDEEGDPIGELVEGDLLDCVRQRANANGEVVDEYGRVVGHVRTCAPHAAPAAIAPTQQIPSAVTATNTQTSDIIPEATGKQPVQQPVTMAKPDAVPVQTETSPVATEQQDEPRSEPVVEPAAEQTNSQPIAVPQLSLPAQDSKRMSRSASERSLSELSKPYARPTMSSVPEHNVPDDDAIPASPTLYAYKGEIPMTDGAQQNKRRSRSPPYPVNNPKALPGPGQYAKSALVGGHAGNTLFPPMRPVGMSSRTNRQPLHSAMKKSAANGYPFDITPNGSDSGSDPSSSDDGRMLTFGAHSRNSSMHTVGTMTKPRTYFTHAGKVTIDPASSTESETPAPAKTAPASAPAPAEKKKSRMSMSFGKKSKAAA